MNARRLPSTASIGAGAGDRAGTAPRVRALKVLMVLTVSCLNPLALPGAWASDNRDHERARAAVQAGEVLPLPTLLDKLRRSHPGQVLELELEREHGRWVYEVKLLQPGGQLVKLEVDAATGQVLKLKRKAEPDKDPQRRTLEGDIELSRLPQARPR